MLETFKGHWPEYLMEAAELALLVIALCVLTVALEHPASPLRQMLPDPFLRRCLKGLAIAMVIIGIVYSPLGKQSGAHLNPTITLTYFRLGKIQRWDVVFYILAQFVGGFAGVLIASLALRGALASSVVRFAATAPGMPGPWVAFLAEALISFGLMLVILIVSNRPTFARSTSWFAAALTATYIILETPLSGMSMNPARSLAPALFAHLWPALWIYFLAPPLGMLLAAQVYVWMFGKHTVICAKLHHHNDKRCIFNCGYRAVEKMSQPAQATQAS